MNVIVDIDGTIADNSHRLHHIRKEDGAKPTSKDWNAFHDALLGDSPIQSVINVVEALWAHGHHILLVTGRAERNRRDTMEWLLRHNVPVDGLLMRPNGDFRPDYEIKEEILLTQLGGPEGIHLVIEDRRQVVEMWRKHGLRVLHCADGEY